MSRMTRRFVAALEEFVARQDIPLVQFFAGQRKDTVMAEHLRHLRRDGGVVFSAKRKKTPPCSAPNGGAVRERVGHIRGSCGAGRW
jgi:hypothetical protein